MKAEYPDQLDYTPLYASHIRLHPRIVSHTLHPLGERLGALGKCTHGERVRVRARE